MKDMLGHALSVLMGFFAIKNPFANTPIFLGLTADDSPDMRRRVALKALATTFGLIVLLAAIAFG